MRASFRNNTSIRWTRVYDLPDFVYFNHSIHVNKGIGCESCHGRVDRMPLTWQENSLQMEWCLDCHRHPEKHVRPREFITTMGYQPAWQSRRDRTPAGEGIPDSRRAHTNQLFHLPSMSDLHDNEFPPQAIGWSEDEDAEEGRRNFLKLMGASLALAGLTACTRQPTEHIMPYVRQPEDLIPGKPLFYATAMTLGGVANGVLAESHEGRPTKIEGNPEHPATLGACDVFSQASVLGLYDPDRSQALTLEGEISSWGTLTNALRDALNAQKSKNGAGIRILTETVTSPTLANQLGAIQKAYPASKWHQWEPAGPHSARAGASLAFGQPTNTYYNLANANTIVSLDSDFLASGVASLRYARQFAARRRVRGNQTAMNRLYVVEPMPTPTGAKADHRLPLRAADIEVFAGALATALGVAKGPTNGENHDIYKWIGAIARDLRRNQGASLVIAGEYQPAAVHALAHVMNSALGNVGKTVFYTDPIEANPVDQVASLQDLVKDLDAGAVDLLLVVGGNPVFTAPVEWGMGDRIQKARLRVHLSLYHNETSEVCQWHVPETHYLETWGDARAFDGTVTIQQPLIQPLYGGRSANQFLQMLTESPDTSPYEIVKGYWASQHKGADFEAWWRRAVHDGVVPDTALPTKAPAIHGEAITARIAAPRLGGKLEVMFRPDPTIYDGRFANNGWLQELPKPITKLTWDNAAILSPATAHRLKAETGDLVQLTYQGRSLRAPVFIQPGHSPEAGGKLEVMFRPDPTIYDGRFANNGWLQELPKPITKLTWDNAAILSPATAHRLKAATGDMVQLTYQGRSLRAPVFIQPGHIDGAVTLHLGYGRTRAGRAGTGMGFNPYGLRTATGPVARHGARGAEGFRQVRVCHHSERSRAGRQPPHHSQGRHRGLQEESGIGARGRRDAGQGTDASIPSGNTKATRGAWRSI